jgi:hypothetical protein
MMEFPGPEYLIPGEKYAWWSDRSKAWRQTGEPRNFDPSSHITWATYLGPHNPADYQKIVHNGYQVNGVAPEALQGHQFQITQGGYDGRGTNVRATKDDPSDPQAAKWENFRVFDDAELRHMMTHADFHVDVPPGGQWLDMTMQDAANRKREEEPLTLPKSWSKRGNILDPVHETLDPTVWDAAHESYPVLKPQHRDWIVDTIEDILKHHGYGDMDKWLDLYLTGSLTTFQYSADSDCDVSLFVNTDVFPEWSRAEMIGLLVSELDNVSLPGTSHPMQGYVVAKGIRPQDLFKPGLRSGYQIKPARWVVPPEKDRSHDVQKEQFADYQFALQQADKMERLLKYEPHKAIEFWHQIHMRRQSDQKQGKGDFSQSNIIYKFLNNRGLFPQLEAAGAGHIAALDMNPLPRTLDDHWLTWQPGQEGKGFILENGTIWHWPTEDQRPMHLQRSAPVKAMGGRVRPETAFHIDESGGVYQIGPGRSLDHLDIARLNMADHRLKLATPPEDAYGHAQDVYDKLAAQWGPIDRPHPDQIEEARRRLNLQHPVRLLPTFKDTRRGGYAGLTRDPFTGGQSHLIYYNPHQHPGARNWAVWHELAHAHQTENGQEFSPNSHLPDEEYAKLPKEHEAEAIAAQHADLDLWENPTNEGLHVGQAEAHDPSQPPSEEAWSFC